MGDFDDDRLNRALDRARLDVVRAREAAMESDLAGTFRALKAAMRELEKGAAVPVSGNGFADDLASYGSFMAQTFTGALIALAEVLGSVPSDVLVEAAADFDAGVAARAFQEWEQGVRAFGRAVRRLDREFEIGPAC